MNKCNYFKTCTILIICSLFLLIGCTSKSVNSPYEGDIHLTLGNPSNASDNIANRDNYLMSKSQYTLSYNDSKKTPNWVSWQLNKSWLGNIERQDHFKSDEKLPKEWYHVKPNDYKNSGYDKGHLAPSADRTKNIEDNEGTFLMTNMIPQTPENNRGIWADLESYSRKLVKEGKELYIIAGGVGNDGVIGKQEAIVIPAKTWKIIVILDQPGLGIKGVTEKTQIIAVEIPNQKGIKLNKDWSFYRVSIDQIEKDTGYDFLSNIDPKIQEIIEKKS